MSRKVIDFDEWMRSRGIIEGRARRVLAFFDMDKLKRRPRASKGNWIRPGSADLRLAAGAGSGRSSDKAS